MIARITLPSGRVVIDTGRVQIGLLAQPHKPPQPGSQAELMQRVLTAPLPREWHEHPTTFPVSRPLWRRVLDLFTTSRKP